MAWNRVTLQMTTLLLMALVLSAMSATERGSNRAVRTQRGFKSSSLSTARGFGKRDGSTLPLPLLLRLNAFRDSDRSASTSGERKDSFPVSWFAEELQNNPELARIVVDKFIDENGDGELTPDELLSRFF